MLGMFSRARETMEADSYIHKDLGLFNSTQNPARIRLSPGNERSILTSITNRIALDVASFNIEHVRVDDNNQYLETINGPLNDCLRVEANKDQTGRVLIQGYCYEYV